MDIIERLINRPKRTATFPICVDPNQQEQVRQARQRLQVADLVAARDDAGAEALLEATAAKEAFEGLAAGTEIATFALQAVGSDAVEQLFVDYPPTKQQLAQAKQMGAGAPRFDEDEVYPRLLTQSITTVTITGGSDEGVAGPLSLDQVKAIWRSPSWPRDDLDELAALALAINSAGTKTEALGKG